jgi:tagatose 6-phosphate kinase
MILCVGTTPAVQRVMTFRRFAVGEVNRATAALDGVAGKSVNVAKVLRALGAEVVAAGFVGGERAAVVCAALTSRRIAAEFVNVAANTRQCVTVLDEAGGTQTELVEEGPAVSAADYAALREAVGHRIGAAAAVVLSGTLAPGGLPTFYQDLVERGRAAGALTAVDAVGLPLVERLSAEVLVERMGGM